MQSFHEVNHSYGSDRVRFLRWYIGAIVVMIAAIRVMEVFIVQLQIELEITSVSANTVGLIKGSENTKNGIFLKICGGTLPELHSRLHRCLLEKTSAITSSLEHYRKPDGLIVSCR